MSDERALLRAVCHDPEDDAPRLVYADWLDDHGRAEQAEFIRLQCALAADPADSPARRRRASRMRELRDGPARDWLRPDDHWHDAVHRRGLVEYVGVMACDFEEQAARMFDTMPVRGLWLTEAGDLTDLRAVPADNRLRTLELTGTPLEPSVLPILAALPALAGVRELGLMFTDLGDDAVPALCGEPFFGRLERLHLAGNPFTPAGRDRLRGHFGGRVSFEAVRQPDHLYTFNHQDDRFTVGFGEGDTQLLLLCGYELNRAAVFDHEGNLLELREETAPDAPRSEERSEAALQEWCAAWHLRPATIRVKRFRFPDGIGITDFSPSWCEELDDPASTERENARWVIDRWLFDGKFRWQWAGGDWWLDCTGVVTDT